MADLTFLLTLNNRSVGTMERVFAGIGINQRQVIVLDRPESHTEAWAKMNLTAWCQNLIGLDGPPGWGCPARAFNAGFAAIRAEWVVCMSSDVVLDAGAVTSLHRACELGVPAVIFGRCVDDGDKPLMDGDDPNLLCSSTKPRPLGFIMAAPMWAVREIGGYDESFMDGIWYDDTDFCFKLWRLGLPFIFDDAISGVHLNHDRPGQDSPEGAAKIERNRKIMEERWGTAEPWIEAPKHGWSDPGLTALAHVENSEPLRHWTLARKLAFS